MYHCELTIAIFSGDPALGELVRAMEPRDRFTHTVEVRTAPDAALLAVSGLVVWDLEGGVTPTALRAQCRADAVVAYCGDRSVLDGLSADELAAADAFWPRPLSPARFRHDLARLLETVWLRYELFMTRTYLDTAIDSIPDMLWFKALDGAHVKVNNAFCTVVGKPREDVTGRDHCYIWGVSPEDVENGAAACRESEEAVIAARRTLQFTESVKSSQGMRQFRTYKSPILDRDGTTVLGTVGIGHDVTDLENMGTELEILLRSMPYAILLWNRDGAILNVNAKFEEYFCTRKEDVLGKNYGQWIVSAFEEQRRVNSEGYVEAKVRTPDGGGKILEIHEDSITDIFQNVVGKLSIYRDVTLERDLEAQILQSSNTDFLTGLYNRRCFYQYIHNNRGERTVSLLYIDLDRFKQVNDTHGHTVGDAVLRRTAELIRASFPEDFVARLGGDEFLVVRLGDCPMPRLEQEAGALLDKLKASYQRCGEMRELSASIGIAQSGDPGLDIDVLLQRSDQALYRAKQEGRSRCCVYE